MQHWLAIVGSGLGVVGTAALSFDLLKSKTAEDSMTQFQHLQDQVDSASQELTVRMNNGLSTLAKFIAGYLSLLEMEAQMAEEGTANAEPSSADPELDEIRRFISGKSKASLRSYAVGKFAEAQGKLASPEDLQRTLNLVAELRGRIERRFAEEVALSQRLRRVAIVGVGLVGIGAVAQLVDLMM